MSLAHYELDPAYGNGVYRRSVRLRLRGDASVATVDDTHHAMWVVLKHDHGTITSVDAGIERGPATSCADAPTQLRTVIGMPLDAPAYEIAARLPPSANCTHLADLLRWAINSVRRGVAAVDYDITVPDQANAPVWMQVHRNGDLLHRWLIDGATLVAPQSFAGRPLFQGFLAWARIAFEDELLEAAIMLQRGAWVARGRRYIVDRSAMPLKAAVGMKDACFSYTGQHWNVATNNIGYVRDFSESIQRGTLPAHVLAAMGEGSEPAE